MWTLPLEGKSRSFRLCSSRSDLKILQWFFHCFRNRIQSLCHAIQGWAPAGLTFRASSLTLLLSPTTWNEPQCPSSSSMKPQPFLLQNSLSLLPLPGMHVLSLSLLHTHPSVSACHLSQEIPLPPGASLITNFLITQCLLQPVSYLVYSFICLFIFPH